MKKISLVFISFLIIVGLLSGCSSQEKPRTTTSSDLQAAQITVSAASSLTDCMQEIQTSFNEQYPKVTITYNFASSGSLQQQIEQGAPADVFFSAGKKQMTALKDSGLMVDDSIKEVLKNRLVLIVPKDATPIESFEELTDKSTAKIAIGDPESVPAGKYADQVFKNLKIADAISDKLVLAKDVREVLAWVETGNVDAGIFYATDALNNDKVTVCATASEDSHDPIFYPVGIVKSSKNQEAASTFVDFLSTDAAKAIFIKYGFTPLT